MPRQLGVAMRDLLHARSVPLLVVVFPVLDGPIDDGYRYRDLHRKLDRVCVEERVACLDLLADFDGRDARRLAVEPFTDGHPNEIGHRIAADSIRDYLRKNRLLPGRPPAAGTTSVVVPGPTLP